MTYKIIIAFVIIVVEIFLAIVLKKGKFLSKAIDFSSEFQNVIQGASVNSGYTIYTIGTKNDYIKEYKLYNINGDKRVSFIYNEYFAISYYAFFYDSKHRLIDTLKIQDNCPKKESTIIDVKSSVQYVDVLPYNVNYEEVKEVKLKKKSIASILIYSLLLCIMMGISLVAVKLFWDYIIYVNYDFRAQQKYEINDYKVIAGLTIGSFVVVFTYLVLKIQMEYKKFNYDGK